MARLLRFGIAAGLPDVHTYQRWAASAEAEGWDLLGFGDSQCLIPEMCVSLAAMATVTDRATLCPTVSNPITRHVSVMAAAFSSLQQLSNGRAMLGLGSGDSAALSIGARPAALAELRDYAAAFTALTQGREVSHQSASVRLEWDAPPVPLMIAAGGPKTMRLAGQHADAVLLGCGLTEDVVRDAVAQVRDAAASAGRDPGGVAIWVFSKIYLCDSAEQAWHDLAWTLAASAHHAFRFSLEGKFVPDEHRAALARLQRDYVVREHNNLARAGQTNAQLVIETWLTEFLGPRFLLAGPPDHVVARIRELASWGVTGFFTSAMFGDPFAYTERVAAQVVRAI